MAVVVLVLTPGPDTLLILGRSIQQGRRAGILSVLGISLGIVAHTLAAALGLSIVLAKSPEAFTAVRWAGAVYLMYLGGQALLSRNNRRSLRETKTERTAARTIFWQAMWTNVLNPKVALFFLAFLPQFIDQQSPQRTLAFVLLGSVFAVVGLSWSVILACFAAAVSRRMRESKLAGVWLDRLTGTLFIGLGLRMVRS